MAPRALVARDRSNRDHAEWKGKATAACKAVIAARPHCYCIRRRNPLKGIDNCPCTATTSRKMHAMLESPVLVSPSAHDHLVHFYEEEGFLHDVVADFLSHGLKSGAPAIVVATNAHLSSFSKRLRLDGV